MTHKDRLLTALNRGVPDQVPVTSELETRYAHTIVPTRGWRGICDAHRLIGSSIFNVQGIGPAVRRHLGPGHAEDRWSEPHPGGGTDNHRQITTPRGTLHAIDTVGYMPRDPSVQKHTEYLIKDRADWEVFADYIKEAARGAEPFVEESVAAYDYIGDDGLVGGWLTDSVYHCADMRRDQDFILDLMEAPDLMEDILAAVDEYTEALLHSCNQSRIECLVYDVCWASLSLLSPSLVRRFVIPRAKRTAELLAKDKYLVFFQTGRIREVVPDLVACGPHGIQHFDVLGDCDLAEIKQSFGRDICLIGNLSPVILANGTPADARADARRCLNAAKAGGGYIMSTSDEVPVDAKLENLRAIVEVVAAEGKY
ncbi:MAG: uroporphyrinogen decarboxylase family protein [Armatimonadia bacterium]